MPYYCCVDGCYNSSSTPGVSTHSITSNSQLLDKWVEALTKDKSKSFNYKNKKICSAHFEKSCFVFNDGLRVLKRGSIPSIFPWTLPGPPSATNKNNAGLLIDPEVAQGEEEENQLGTNSCQTPVLIVPDTGKHSTANKNTFNTFIPRRRPTMCGNCCCTLNDIDYCFSNNLEKENLDSRVVGDLYARDALSFIYGIDWDNFIEELTEHDFKDENVTMSTNLLKETKYSKSIVLCGDCTDKLRRVYIYLHKFEQKSIRGSVIEEIKLYKQRRLNSKTTQANQTHSNSSCSYNSFNFEGHENILFNEEEPVDIKCEVEITIPEEDIKCEIEINNPEEPRNLTHQTIKPVFSIHDGTDTTERKPTREELHLEYYKCPESGCDETFTYEDAWISHIKCHTVDSATPSKATALSCKICGEILKKDLNYKYLHMLSHCKNKFQIRCKLCGKQLRNKRLLNRHLKNVHKENVKIRQGRNCKICNLKIFSKGDKVMEAHLESHKRAAITFTCYLCEEQFNTISELKSHMEGHKDKEKIILFCKVCKRPFRDKDKLLDHEDTHLEENRFSCDICDATFPRKHYVKVHKQSVHSTTNESVVCKLCGRTYKNAQSLKGHIRYSHRDAAELTGLFKCDECQKLFKNSINLRDHKLNRHIRVKLYECSICGQKLSGSVMLKYHLKCHRDNPNFEGKPRKHNLKKMKLLQVDKNLESSMKAEVEEARRQQDVDNNLESSMKAEVEKARQDALISKPPIVTYSRRFISSKITTTISK